MAKHALLSASSSHRWIACPPSARLSGRCKEQPSDYAQQGTDAHSLCEYKLKRLVGIPAKDPTEDLTFYDAEMEAGSEEYAAFISERLEEARQSCNDPLLLIEQRLDFSNYVPEGFGTGDALIVADGKLTICDVKWGKGLLISAEGNSQMRCYALGALNLFDGIYDISSIETIIFQPRLENYSSCTLTRAELLAWAADTLVPAAKLAYAGEGEFCAGEHCRFCRAKAVCRKRAEYNLTLAQYDFKPPETLDDQEIEIVLSRAGDLVSWASEVKEYALREALNGRQWKDWKVVAGRSNRKYISEDAVADAVIRAGYDPYEKKLRGITAMTAALGKKKFAEIIEEAGLIEKPAGKPTLVPITDKRPALSTASEDFDNMED